jgi:hypothetical protein
MQEGGPMRLGYAVPNGKGAQLRFGQVLVYSLAVVSVAAGVVHCSASPDHARLPLHAAFFVTVGMAQILWAPLILRHASRRLLFLGAAGNLALVGVWLFSRTTGIGFVPGAEEVEPVGFKDAVTVFLEVLLVAGVGLWALRPAGRQLLLAKGRLALGAMTGTVALLMAAAVAAPSHQHGHSDAELAAVHGHGDDGHEADHHGDEATVAHPAHLGQAETAHHDAHALGPGPEHALMHAHGDAPQAGVAHHGRHAHSGGDSVEDPSHSHDHASGSVEEGHQHGAASADEGTHDHDPDHQGDHGEHSEHGEQDHNHEGGPLGDLMAIIGEAGKKLGL